VEFFSAEVAGKILFEINRAEFNFSKVKLPFLTLGDEQEVLRSMMCLNLWSEIEDRQPIMSKYDVMRRQLLEPGFAGTLKKMREFGIKRFHINFAVEDIMRYSDYKVMSTYDSLPTTEALIHFKESSNDFFEWSFLPDTIDEDVLESYKECLRSVLPDDIIIPSKEEIFMFTKNSVSFNPGSYKTEPMYKARQSNLSTNFAKSFYGKRCVINISPANTRDTVVTTIDTFNSIKFIDKTILSILDTMSESIISSSPAVSINRLNKAVLHEPGHIYYLRDLRKVGLSCPRRVLIESLNVIREKYPQYDLSPFDVFSSWTVTDEGKYYHPNRGYCLGMANNLITLIQIVVFRMTAMNIPSEIFKVKGHFGNDDSIIRVKPRGDLSAEDCIDILIEEDTALMTGLGFIINTDKSFVSKWPILFEEYHHENFKLKKSRYTASLASAFFYPDISLAKVHVASTSQSFSPECIQACHTQLAKVVDYWGIEFFPGEVGYSYYLGGWLFFQRNGLSTLLEEIERIDEDIIPDAYRCFYKKLQLNKYLTESFMKEEEVTTENRSPLQSKIGQIFDLKTANIILPRTMCIYTSLTKYNKIYSSAYNHMRRPFKFLSEVLRRYKRIRVQGSRHAVQQDIYDLALTTDMEFTIPSSHVCSKRYAFTYSSDDASPPIILCKNAASRVLQYLQDNKVIEGCGVKFSDFPCRDDLKYKEDAYWGGPSSGNFFKLELNEMEFKLLSRYSGNPYLVAFDYFTREDAIPVPFMFARYERFLPHFSLWGTHMTERQWALYNCLKESMVETSAIDLAMSIEDPIMLSSTEQFCSKKVDDQNNPLGICDTHAGGEIPDLICSYSGIFKPNANCDLCTLSKAIEFQEYISTQGEPQERKGASITMDLLKKALRIECYKRGFDENRTALILDPKISLTNDVFDNDDTSEEIGFFSMFE
jgi:hypothetical protein